MQVSRISEIWAAGFSGPGVNLEPSGIFNAGVFGFSFSLWPRGAPHLEDGDFDYSWDMDISVVGDVFTTLRATDFAILLVYLAVDPTVFFPSCDQFFVDPVQHQAAMMNPTQIFPVAARPRPAAPGADERAIRRGMAALPGDKGNPPAARGPGGAPRPRWAAGERLPPPDFGVNPGEGEGESGDEGSQHSPDEDLVPTDDDTDEDGDGGGGRRTLRAHRRAAKHERYITIDGRLFSELVPHGDLTGISLRCKHCGYPRNLTYLPHFSRDEAVRRLLAWEAACPGWRFLHKNRGGKLLVNFA